MYIVGPTLGGLAGFGLARLAAWGEHRIEDARLVAWRGEDARRLGT